MSIGMTPELENLIQSIFESGDYESESNILGEALRLLQQRDKLRAEIQIGLDDLNRGERIDGDVVFEELLGRTNRISS